MAITTQNGAYADPNTNMGKQLTKEFRGDTYLTKHYSDGTGESTFGLPEWIPDDTGKYQPYIIMENPDTYVIENKYLPMSINKADCMTTLYLNNENILNGADTLMEKQYWEVYHKENETDDYQLLDTSTWDCETTFSSGNNFSIFTTWEKSHGYETLQASQYDTTETFANGTIAYFRTLTETTTTPNVVTGQTTITNSTGTFTIDVIEDVTTTTTTNIPVIPSEIKSEFQVEYRYMLDDGEVESFTRITNNDVNLENHYFQFINKFDGVNYQQFNLGDDIEFTDDSYIGTYYATAENVPQKYIGIAEQGYPLYYSLEKGIKWWTGAGATIYMDGEEKKLNVQVDFGKDREPLALNTMQELDPTFSYATVSNDGRLQGQSQSANGGQCDNTWVGSNPNEPYLQLQDTASSDMCMYPYLKWDISSFSDLSLVSDIKIRYDVSSVTNSRNCDFVHISDTDLEQGSMDDIVGTGSGTEVLDNDSTCTTTGNNKVSTLSSNSYSLFQNDISSGYFVLGIKFNSMTADGSDHGVHFGDNDAELQVTYVIATVTGAPTNLSATGASTSQIDLSWTAPDTSSASVPAVSGYRIQSSDFAFANASLPTGRTADADVYGAIDGGVDMDTANLYLSMNTTQYTGAYANSIGSHTATLSGASSNSATAINGKTSLDFDGSNDYISLGTALNNSDGNGDIVSDTGAWTWAGWVYVDSTSDSHNHIVFSKIYNDYESGKEHSMFLRQATSNWLLMSTEGGSVNNAVAHTGWTHLAVTVSGIGGTQTWSIYEDGGTPATFSASNHYWDNEPILLGGQDSGNDDTPDTRWMDGQMQDFAFWNRALSQAEIQSLVNSYDYSSSTGSGNTGKVATTIPSGLIAYYPLDSTTVINSLYSADDENNILDESYRGNHATLYGDSSITDSPSYTQTGSCVVASGTEIEATDCQTNQNPVHRVYKDIGSISDSAFYFEFDYKQKQNDNNLFPISLQSGTGKTNIASEDMIYVKADGLNLTIAKKNGGSNTNSSDGWITIVANTQYYGVLIRDGNTASLKIYDDSARTNQVGTTKTVNVSDVSGLQHLHSESRGDGGGGTNMGWVLDNLVMNNNKTDKTLSLDSSLNMEGTNSAVFDGSNDYMTLPSDNTIIPTSSAFMMGANIKPDILNSTATYKQTILSYPTSAGSVDFNIEGANLVFRSGDKNNDPIISSAHGMSSGTKYNVAVSRDGSNNFEIFVQGDRVGSVVSNSTALGSKSSGELHYIGKNLLKSDNTATHTDSFTSDSWTDQDSAVAGVSNNRLEFTMKVDGESNDGTSLDLGSALSDSAWVLQWEGTYTSTSSSGNGHNHGFCLSDADSSTNSGSNADRICFQWGEPSVSGQDLMGILVTDNSAPSATGSFPNSPHRQNSHGISGDSTTRYYELIRDSATSATLNVRTGSHTGTMVTGFPITSDDPTSTVDGLRYLVLMNRSGDGQPRSGEAVGYYDNVKIYDGVTCVSDCETSSNYYDGRMDEFYVLAEQSDDTISNISSRGESTWTDRSYNTGGTGTTYSHTSISGGGGTEVAYRVSAHNSVGLSEYDLVLGQTENTPSAPQNLSIASTSSTVLTLDWDAPASQGASSISAYKVYRGTSSGFTLDSNSLVTTITDTSVTEYANSGLTADTRYYFSVLATNAQGDGTQADANAYTLLNAPTSLTATGVSTSQINLAWTAPSGANNLDGYKIEYNDGSWQTLVADTGSTGTTYSHTSLSTGNSFTYRVSGLFGSLAGLTSNTAQGSTYAVPSAITDLSGTGLTGSSLRISWTAPSSTPALTGYMIEISEDNFSTSTTLESNTGNTDTSYDATGLSENVDYYFRVKAINSLGTASTSNIPTVQTGASQSGGGGGGGGSPSFIPQFDELISLSVFGNAHKLTLGESIQDTLRLEWNSAEDLQVNEVIVGDNPFRFAVQKPPFIVLGDADGLSNAEISYTIQVPNNYCTMDITVQCVEPDFYEVPVNVKVLSEGRTITKNVVITVDLSSGFDPALFVILLVAGIASFGIYRISKGSSGKKKNGSVRKTVNSKPKGRKNGSVKKALSL